MTRIEAEQKRQDMIDAAKRFYDNLRPAFAATGNMHAYLKMRMGFGENLVVFSDGHSWHVGSKCKDGSVFVPDELVLDGMQR